MLAGATVLPLPSAPSPSQPSLPSLPSLPLPPSSHAPSHAPEAPHASHEPRTPRLGTDVVVNRRASRLAGAEGLRSAVTDTAHRYGARVHETQTLDDLAEVARRIASNGTSAVVLAGGDGSYMAGLSALARAFGDRPLPPIALAPGGTVCTVARNFGMRGRPRAAAEAIVRAACQGNARAVRRPTLRVRDDGGGDRVGFIFGAGLVLRFFDAYYAAPRQGVAAAAVLVARIFAGSFANAAFARKILDPARCSIRVDGEPHAAREWSLVLASVIRDVGLHMLVPYRAGEETERFHTVASGLSPRVLGAQLPRVLAGRPLKGEPRIDALARSLRVAFEGDAAADGGYVLDGDVVRARVAQVEPGPVISVLTTAR
jgi:diacylglycerol kinase (ATP)